MKHLSKEQSDRFCALVDELESLSETERTARLAQLRESEHEDESVVQLVELHVRAPGLRSGDSSAGLPPRGSDVVAANGARRYRVDQEIGRGGMGVVLGVWDEALARPLAMKVLNHPLGADSAGDEERVRRFLEEAHVAAQLDHPGIAPVHELGTSTDGTRYFTMKRVRGRSLAEIFELARRGEESWNTTRVVALLLKVCETMAYAHDHGVIHRDLKPDNVMIGEFGEAYVMDWGVARALDGRGPGATSRRTSTGANVRDNDVSRPTRDGTALGTPEYMAPEQAMGRLADVGTAADVYAVGAMLYHLLAGEPPYRDQPGHQSAEALLARIRNGPPRPLPESASAGAAELAAICQRAMSRDPGARYPTMLQLAEDLRSLLEGRVVHAYETGPLAELRKWVLRNRGFATALFAALMTLLGGMFALAIVQTESRRRQMLESDLYLLNYLHEQEAGLWPGSSAARNEIDTWLRQARSVLSREGDHRRRLEAARADASEDASAELRLKRCERVMESLRALGAEGGLVQDVERRVQLADEAVTRYASQWADAIALIEQDLAIYGGLKIEPQLGLVPLGADPLSKLWEFAHLPSGDIPQRDGSGQLILTERSGIVLVLLPGGSFHMGSQTQDPGKANFDTSSLSDEGPVLEVTLAPFLIAKHEMTQAQWLRATGENPSEYAASQVHGGVSQTLLCPVEKVSWDDCVRVLAQQGLLLPTEAQWEYAARAGTRSPWWTGDDPATLQRAANLADLAAEQAEAPFPEFVTWDDGYPVTAPVNTLAPNPFGLHHVYGNVWEWTSDLEGSYKLGLEPPDGRRVNPNGRDRVLRGGGSDSGASLARSAYRYYADEHHRDGFAGLRPAAALRLAGAE